MGYGISAGKGIIWICMPYLNGAGTANVISWWGDPPKYQLQPTIDYCTATVKLICERYGGDSRKVILAGFSRGSIACNYIGLQNDQIASLWRGFICYANYDGLHAWPYPDDDRASAAKRLQRLGRRPQFICQEIVSKPKDALDVTRTYLKQAYPDGNLTFELIPFRNHNDAWTLRDIPSRRALRKWFAEALLAGMAGANDQPPPTFRLVPDGNKPAFELGPNQCRMASCYRDKAGTYHLFTDFMEKVPDSFGAEIRYYRSSDLRNWIFVDTVVKKGAGADADAFGAASPHVLATDKRIYLFYSGRSEPVGGRFDAYARPGQPGYAAGRILLATAAADEQGAPAGAFRKQGVLAEPGDGWDAMRLDDPCAVLEGDTVHLFFKGFDNNRNRDHVRVGYARAALAEMRFTKHSEPILAVPGGGEMPRVFREGGAWHMFYHHFGVGSTWRHHVSEDGLHWRLHDSSFFGGHLTGGPRDIMMIYGMNGTLLEEPEMLVAGSQDGINKLWLYYLRKKGAEGK
ncbi:MAG: hypothetical protein NTV49_10065 [Kiritimatiellaeota bacterium]|nr:hypothetical protein [Kiritimatiellota bacterium]